MKKRTYYRTIFISDLHLGFRGAQAKHLLSFLRSVDCETLYLVGDIIDLWAMRKKIWWNEDCNRILQRLLKMHKQGTRIIYLPGNHDEAIRTFLPFELGLGIEFTNETIFNTRNGARYMVLHGDVFDLVVGKMKWLALLGTTLYDWLLAFNGILHYVRLKLGYSTYWSLAGYLKAKAKRAASFIKDFEGAVIHHAKKNDCDGVICGHIHTPKSVMIDGVHYVNCGDWVESLTAVVENEQGALELIHWHDNHIEGISDGMAIEHVGI